MSPLSADSTITLAFWVVVKASAALAVAAGVQMVSLRAASAAMRHLVWTLAILGVLLLPAAVLVLPSWPLAIPSTGASHGAAQVVDPVDAGSGVMVNVDRPALLGPVQHGDERPRPSPISTTDLIAIVYAAGVLMTLLYLGTQHRSVRRLVRGATSVDDARWTGLVDDCARRIGVHRRVRVLRSRERLVPATFGTRRPSIILPAAADAWTDDRRRAVLMHELAHVARLDCLTQLVASVACAIYWFHPMVWWVDRRMRAERELACDDRVIGAGAEAREYAGHLLEIAYSLGGHRAPALAVSMARPGQLEGRMLAALDRTRNRRIPTATVRIVTAAIAVAVLGPLAVAAPLFIEVDRLDGAVRATRDAVRPQPSRSAPPVARSVHPGATTSQDVSADVPAGTWEIRPTNTSGTVYLHISEGRSQSGTNVPVATLEGLTAAQLTGAGGPVSFRLRRDAGTFVFEGVVRQGVGAGTVSFTPDPTFPGELAKRGYGKPSAREQYELARYDVGYRFVDELNTQGYSKTDTAGLVRAGQHGVNTAYLSDMGALGYRLGALDALITLRDHGVDPTYVRQLADLGYKGLSADDLRRARDHGITPEYVRGMREAGYGSLPMGELITARDHGVTVEFVQALSEAGHGKVPLEQLVRVRDHGVSPDYVRDMRQSGYALGLDDLVRARDHGVSSEFVRRMADLGYKTSAIDALIRLRDHGVTPEYVQEVKALGYDRLSIDDLVRLRDHGLSAERIRQANSSAGSRLSVDELQAVAEGRAR